MQFSSSITLLISCISIIFLASHSQAGRIEKYTDTQREARRITFAFYGKVTDLDGNPISDAQVILTKSYIPLYPSASELMKIRCTTDSQGLFTVNENGYILSLEQIDKPGYEYNRKYIPNRIFKFKKDIKKAELGQFPDQPVIFKIRMKNLPTLVLGANARFSLEPDGQAAFFDLLWQQWCFPNNLLTRPMDYKGWQPYLKIYLEGNRQNCRLVIESIDANTGMVEDRRELFEAPQSGYKPKLVIPVPKLEKGDGVTTFVYVKGRSGKFYSRMDILLNVGIHSDSDKRYARLNIDYRTNPNGGRSFESDKELGIKYSEDVRAGKRHSYGYDPNAKGLSIEDVRKLLGK